MLFGGLKPAHSTRRSQFHWGLAILGCAAALTGTACAKGDAQLPQPVLAAGYEKLVFAEDFSKLDLSPDGGGGHRWFNALWYRPQISAEHFVQEDGYVRFVTQVEPKSHVLMTSITTMPRRPGGTATLFQYGYFEARMRFTPGPYNWPAFWLLAPDLMRFDAKIGKGSWCEIDVFEGGLQGWFQGTVHDWKDFKSTTNDNYRHRLPLGTKFEDWHTYGALWTKSSISWFFDGKLLASTPTPEVCRQQQMYIIVGAQKRPMGPEPENLDVDWIHVYH